MALISSFSGMTIIPTPARPTAARARGSRAHFRLLRFCRCLGLGGRLEQASERLRRESAPTRPVSQAILVDLEWGLPIDDLHLLGRIEGTDVLKEPTAARAALVGHDHAIKRLLLGARASKADMNGHEPSVSKST